MDKYINQLIRECNEDNELYHHGILGMKWGKKNGPPYPLGSSDHSASEKKAGWRKSLDKSSSDKHTKSTASSSEDSEKKKGLSDKQKTALKIGAAAVGTALVAYGGYRLYKSGKLDGAISSGKSVVASLIGKGKTSGSAETVEKAAEYVNGIKKLAHKETIMETAKQVNPNRGDPAYVNNCTSCGIAAILRQCFGLDVEAASTGGKQQLLGGVVEECFKNAKVVDGSAIKFGQSQEAAAEMLKKRFGDNAAGVVSVQWDPNSGLSGEHTFNWQIIHGITVFYDTQIGSDRDISDYWKRINPNDALTIARLDNAEINFDAIKKYIKSR